MIRTFFVVSVKDKADNKQLYTWEGVIAHPQNWKEHHLKKALKVAFPRWAADQNRDLTDKWFSTTYLGRNCDKTLDQVDGKQYHVSSESIDAPRPIITPVYHAYHFS